MSVLLAVGLPMALVVGLALWMEHRSGLGRLMRTSVVAHLDGQSIRGVVVGLYRDAVVMEHARLLTAQGDVEMSGTITIPRANVRYVQQVPPEPVVP